jgi:hypothetical protein
VGDRYPSGPYEHINAVSTRLRPTSDERCSFVSLESSSKQETRFHLVRGQPRTGDAVPCYLRAALGGRRGSVSPKAILEREKLFRLSRGELWVGGIVPSRRRPTSGRRCSHDSLEANLGWKRRNALWASDDLPSKTCPRAATKLNASDRTIESCVDASGREVERTRSARYSEITRMKGN